MPKKKRDYGILCFLGGEENFLKKAFLPRTPSFKNFETGVLFFYQISYQCITETLLVVFSAVFLTRRSSYSFKYSISLSGIDIVLLEFSVLGSFTMFFCIRKLFGEKFRNKIKNKPKVTKFMNVVDKLTYSQLVLITSIPFSPSFFINLGAGLSKINMKKYFCALLIGKFAEMIFLGYVGVSLIECLTQPLALVKVVIIMLIGYGASVVVNKRFNLDERFE